MLKRLRFVKRLFVDVPKYGKLAYCLVRDPRVSPRNKAIFGGALAMIFTPFIDIPSVIPVVGELDVLALTLVALRLFVASCPDEVVEEHEQLIVEQRSRFDEDLRSGEGLAVSLARRFRRQEQDHDRSIPVEYRDLSRADATADERRSGVGA